MCTADAEKAARFLRDELEPSGDGRCAVYFAEWQFATDDGEYLVQLKDLRTATAVATKVQPARL